MMEVVSWDDSSQYMDKWGVVQLPPSQRVGKPYPSWGPGVAPLALCPANVAAAAWSFAPHGAGSRFVQKISKPKGSNSMGTLW